ncbi:MAG TPA: DNA repair protein RecN [Pyrinomonadaceae bacterium]|nr:DNA repair protein RecN [Pyrinomonadaceae bacterium]
MLTLLSISNIALIAELRVEFDHGLNLLTGETGSGKSIIVDALGVLIGGRVTSDLLKTGAERAFIEGLFSVAPSPELENVLAAAGISIPGNDSDEAAEPAPKDRRGSFEMIIRRELSTSGRNKIFINNQLATQALLREVRPFLVDIHGQGDQQTLFNSDTHLELLDEFAGASVAGLCQEVAECYRGWNALRRELDSLQAGESEKFQLADILKFQINELEHVELAIGEDATLEEERRRLLNVEKLTLLCAESYALIYEDKDAALTRVRLAEKQIEELAGFESGFNDYLEGLTQARSVLEDLAFSLRDFSDKLEFSPARLEQIGNRLAEISSIKRKYGGSIEAALEHLARSEDRLRQIDHAGERETEIKEELETARAAYLDCAGRLHRERVRAARKFERAVEQGLVEVAMEKAKFQIRISGPEPRSSKVVDDSNHFTARGSDQIDFYFSANVGEEVKPLAKVASGGEASRLMLVLKTVANASEFPRTIVFDEIDSGIGGRVSEAVGIKLKKLSGTNQVLCVTHQPQIARFAESHLLVRKETVGERTLVSVENLDRRARVEEIARMLTGAEITESARRHARELLKS